MFKSATVPPQSGNFGFDELAQQLFDQIETITHGDIPPSPKTNTLPWRYIRVIQAWAWGNVGQLPVEMENLLPANEGSLPPQPTVIDMNAANADAPYATMKFAPTSWAATTSTINVFALSQAKCCHVLVEVW
jgi:hypothetical protein